MGAPPSTVDLAAVRGAGLNLPRPPEIDAVGSTFSEEVSFAIVGGFLSAMLGVAAGEGNCAILMVWSLLSKPSYKKRPSPSIYKRIYLPGASWSTL